MDDVLIHSKHKDHMKHIVALLEATIKNGLKISPKKCQLFMKNVVYMGHTISYEGKTPTITPTRDKYDAIRRVEKLSTVKDV